MIIGLAKANALPQIPGLLLALTSASAATYAANKTIGRNKPKITAVTPMAAHAGDLLTIDGANFIPDGTTSAPTVTIGNAPAMVKGGSIE